MKKLMALLMALMMLALPMAGLAEDVGFIEAAAADGMMIQRETTFKAGESLTGIAEVDQIIQELLDALKITTCSQGQEEPQSGLTLSLSDTPVLTVQYAVKDHTVYLCSDLLAGNTLAVSADEADAAAEKLTKLLAAVGNMSESDQAEVRQALSTALTALTNPEAIESGMNIDVEAMAEGFANADVSGLVEVVQQIMARMEETDASAQPEGGDPAVSAYRTTITCDEIIKIYETIFEALKGNEAYMAFLDSIAAASEGEITSGAALFDSLIAQLKETLPQLMHEPATVVYYFDGNDEPVASTFEVQLSSDDQSMNMTCAFTRLTESDGAKYRVIFNADAGDESMNMDLTVKVLSNGFKADVTVKAPDGADGSFGLEITNDKTDTTSAGKGAFTMAIAGDEPVDLRVDVTNDARKLDVGAEQTTVITLTVNGRMIVTVTSEATTQTPAASIATDGAVHPARMSDEELQAFLSDVAGNLQTWLITLMQALPTSVLMMLMGQ